MAVHADELDRVLRRRKVLSPLRYPGGKRRLVPYIAAALVANDMRPGLFVEPFAGGASVSIELLHADLVDRVALGDSDPLVSAFWRTVFEDHEWLCRQVETIEVNLEAWQRFKTGRFRARRSLALACLFLNRTSFNGALHHHAGAIGGRKQVSAYKLDCRFSRLTLVKRIKACAALSDRVVLIGDEAARTISDARALARHKGCSTFFYLDPPFWANSDRLYRHSFDAWQHEELAEQLLWLKDPWLLSYDPAPEIEAHYAGHRGVQAATVELLYTATRRSGEQELVVTNLDVLPAETRLWRSSQKRSGPMAASGS